MPTLRREGPAAPRAGPSATGPAAANAAVAGNYADPDGDGLSNLEEYAFNTDPLASNPTRSVSASLVTTNGQKFLALTFPLVTAALDITYRVEASPDLQSWLTGCTYSGTNRVTVTAHTTEFSRTGAGLETIIVRDNTPVGATPHRFLRLRVTRP